MMTSQHIKTHKQLSQLPTYPTPQLQQVLPLVPVTLIQSSTVQQHSKQSWKASCTDLMMLTLRFEPWTPALCCQQ